MFGLNRGYPTDDFELDSSPNAPDDQRVKPLDTHCNALSSRGCTINFMPNIASVLKSEISRVARKEVRSEVQSLRKAVTTYRSEIAALKRRTQALEQEMRRLTKTGAHAAPAPAPDESAQGFRFSSKGLASQRRRLGLSADDAGVLIGASGQSVYNWEAGKARPRAQHLPAIGALRQLGKKEAAARLAAARKSR